MTSGLALVADSEGELTAVLAHETAPQYRRPGTFMHDALAYRDQWESRLLRTSSWSPLY